MLELGAVKKAIYVSCYGIGSHDQSSIDGVNVSACDGALGVTEKSGDRRFGEAQVVRNAGVAVAQDVWCNARQRRASKNLDPVLRKADQRLSIDRSGEDRPRGMPGAACVQQIDHRKTNRADGRTLFAVSETQTAIVDVHLRPYQIDNFASPAAGQRDCSSHRRCGGNMIVLHRLLKEPAKQAIFAFGAFKGRFALQFFFALQTILKHCSH